MSDSHDPSPKIGQQMDFRGVVELLVDLARERLRHEAGTGRSRLITRRITHGELDDRLASLLGEIESLQSEAADLPQGPDRAAQRKIRGLHMAARRARDLAERSASERHPARRDRMGPKRRRRKFECALVFLVMRSRALAAQLRAVAQRSGDAFDPGDILAADDMQDALGLLTADELQHAFDITHDHPLVRLERFAERAERIAAEARAVFDAAPLRPRERGRPNKERGKRAATWLLGAGVGLGLTRGRDDSRKEGASPETSGADAVAAALAEVSKDRDALPPRERAILDETPRDLQSIRRLPGNDAELGIVYDAGRERGAKLLRAAKTFFQAPDFR